jgi:hypothetical protein
MPLIRVNKSPVDQYSILHFGSGVAARKYGVGFWPTLIGGFVFDYALEPIAKRQIPDIFPHPSQDAPLHQFIDAITPAIGWLIFDWFKRREDERKLQQQTILKGF